MGKTCVMQMTLNSTLLRLMPKLLPVTDRRVHHRAEGCIRHLLDLPVTFPLTVPKPWRWNESRKSEDSCVEFSTSGVCEKAEHALLAYLPGNLTVLVSERGSLFHSYLLPKPRLCVNDSTDGATACSLYQGTLIAVDLDDTGAWAYDVYAMRGESLIHEGKEWRSQRLPTIRTCVPDLRFAWENPRARQTRVWDSNPCAWKVQN